MRCTRREFLKTGSAAAAVLASPHIFARAFAARAAHAAGPADPILVIVQWEGGNDGLNTVIPLNGTQRSAYEALRPDLGIPVAEISGLTEIGDDPAGIALGFHPVMTALHQLYDAGKVAVINGVGYPNQDLSHFRSEDIWFKADPVGSPGTGWFGNYLDQYVDPSLVRAISFDYTTTKVFDSAIASAIGVARLSYFTLPEDYWYPDLEARKAVWRTIYPLELTLPGLYGTVGNVANNVVALADRLASVQTAGWGSNVEALEFNSRFSRSLREVASIIRHDILDPTNDTGMRFFHVRIGGFDTHSQQEEAVDPANPQVRQDNAHGRLLYESSEVIKALYDDLASIPDGAGSAADRALIMTFSEFGRRPAQNASLSDAGTDHGAAAPLFLIGSAVQGGIYGPTPDLTDLDADDNLKFHTDFRQVYATAIDRWVASDGVADQVIPNSYPGQWTPIPGVLP
jgi:uncharacterized protein (DUF1501 family)